ncbi:uncharacterized protein LOC144453475 isoform X2 [Glandiceps talaboti]
MQYQPSQIANIQIEQAMPSVQQQMESSDRQSLEQASDTRLDDSSQIIENDIVKPAADECQTSAMPKSTVDSTSDLTIHVIDSLPQEPVVESGHLYKDRHEEADQHSDVNDNTQEIAETVDANEVILKRGFQRTTPPFFHDPSQSIEETQVVEVLEITQKPEASEGSVMKVEDVMPPHELVESNAETIQTEPLSEQVTVSDLERQRASGLPTGSIPEYINKIEDVQGEPEPQPNAQEVIFDLGEQVSVRESRFMTFAMFDIVQEMTPMPMALIPTTVPPDTAVQYTVPATVTSDSPTQHYIAVQVPHTKNDSQRMVTESSPSYSWSNGVAHPTEVVLSKDTNSWKPAPDVINKDAYEMNEYTLQHQPNPQELTIELMNITEHPLESSGEYCVIDIKREPPEGGIVKMDFDSQEKPRDIITQELSNQLYETVSPPESDSRTTRLETQPVQDASDTVEQMVVDEQPPLNHIDEDEDNSPTETISKQQPETRREHDEATKKDDEPLPPEDEISEKGVSDLSKDTSSSDISQEDVDSENKVQRENEVDKDISKEEMKDQNPDKIGTGKGNIILHTLNKPRTVTKTDLPQQSIPGNEDSSNITSSSQEADVHKQIRLSQVEPEDSGFVSISEKDTPVKTEKLPITEQNIVADEEMLPELQSQPTTVYVLTEETSSDDDKNDSVLSKTNVEENVVSLNPPSEDKVVKVMMQGDTSSTEIIAAKEIIPVEDYPTQVVEISPEYASSEVAPEEDHSLEDVLSLPNVQPVKETLKRMELPSESEVTYDTLYLATEEGHSERVSPKAISKDRINTADTSKPEVLRQQVPEDKEVCDAATSEISPQYSSDDLIPEENQSIEDVLSIPGEGPVKHKIIRMEIPLESQVTYETLCLATEEGDPERVCSTDILEETTDSAQITKPEVLMVPKHKEEYHETSEELTSVTDTAEPRATSVTDIDTNAADKEERTLFLPETSRVAVDPTDKVTQVIDKEPSEVTMKESSVVCDDTKKYIPLQTSEGDLSTCENHPENTSNETTPAIDLSFEDVLSLAIEQPVKQRVKRMEVPSESEVTFETLYLATEEEHPETVSSVDILEETANTADASKPKVLSNQTHEERKHPNLTPAVQESEPEFKPMHAVFTVDEVTTASLTEMQSAVDDTTNQSMQAAVEVPSAPIDEDQISSVQLSEDINNVVPQEDVSSPNSNTAHASIEVIQEPTQTLEDLLSQPHDGPEKQKLTPMAVDSHVSGNAFHTLAPGEAAVLSETVKSLKEEVPDMESYVVIEGPDISDTNPINEDTIHTVVQQGTDDGDEMIEDTSQELTIAPEMLGVKHESVKAVCLGDGSPEEKMGSPESLAMSREDAILSSKAEVLEIKQYEYSEGSIGVLDNAVILHIESATIEQDEALAQQQVTKPCKTEEETVPGSKSNVDNEDVKIYEQGDVGEIQEIEYQDAYIDAPQEYEDRQLSYHVPVIENSEAPEVYVLSPTAEQASVTVNRTGSLTTYVISRDDFDFPEEQIASTDMDDDVIEMVIEKEQVTPIESYLDQQAVENSFKEEKPRELLDKDYVVDVRIEQKQTLLVDAGTDALPLFQTVAEKGSDTESETRRSSSSEVSSDGDTQMPDNFENQDEKQPVTVREFSLPAGFVEEQTTLVYPGEQPQDDQDKEVQLYMEKSKDPNKSLPPIMVTTGTNTDGPMKAGPSVKDSMTDPITHTEREVVQFKSEGTSPVQFSTEMMDVSTVTDVEVKSESVKPKSAEASTLTEPEQKQVVTTSTSPIEGLEKEEINNLDEDSREHAVSVDASVLTDRAQEPRTRSIGLSPITELTMTETGRESGEEKSTELTSETVNPYNKELEERDLSVVPEMIDISTATGEMMNATVKPLSADANTLTEVAAKYVVNTSTSPIEGVYDEVNDTLDEDKRQETSIVDTSVEANQETELTTRSVGTSPIADLIRTKTDVVTMDTILSNEESPINITLETIEPKITDAAELQTEGQQTRSLSTASPMIDASTSMDERIGESVRRVSADASTSTEIPERHVVSTGTSPIEGIQDEISDTVDLNKKEVTVDASVLTDNIPAPKTRSMGTSPIAELLISETDKEANTDDQLENTDNIKRSTTVILETDDPTIADRIGSVSDNNEDYGPPSLSESSDSSTSTDEEMGGIFKHLSADSSTSTEITEKHVVSTGTSPIQGMYEEVNEGIGQQKEMVDAGAETDQNEEPTTRNMGTSPIPELITAENEKTPMAEQQVTIGIISEANKAVSTDASTLTDVIEKEVISSSTSPIEQQEEEVDGKSKVDIETVSSTDLATRNMGTSPIAELIATETSIGSDMEEHMVAENNTAPLSESVQYILNNELTFTEKFVDDQSVSKDKATSQDLDESLVSVVRSESPVHPVEQEIEIVKMAESKQDLAPQERIVDEGMPSTEDELKDKEDNTMQISIGDNIQEDIGDLEEEMRNDGTVIEYTEIPIVTLDYVECYPEITTAFPEDDMTQKYSTMALDQELPQKKPEKCTIGTNTDPLSADAVVMTEDDSGYPTSENEKSTIKPTSSHVKDHKDSSNQPDKPSKSSIGVNTIPVFVDAEVATEPHYEDDTCKDRHMVGSIQIGQVEPQNRTIKAVQLMSTGTNTIPTFHEIATMTESATRETVDSKKTRKPQMATAAVNTEPLSAEQAVLTDNINDYDIEEQYNLQRHEEMSRDAEELPPHSFLYDSGLLTLRAEAAVTQLEDVCQLEDTIAPEITDGQYVTRSVQVPDIDVLPRLQSVSVSLQTESQSPVQTKEAIDSNLDKEDSDKHAKEEDIMSNNTTETGIMTETPKQSYAEQGTQADHLDRNVEVSEILRVEQGSQTEKAAMQMFDRSTEIGTENAETPREEMQLKSIKLQESTFSEQGVQVEVNGIAPVSGTTDAGTMTDPTESSLVKDLDESLSKPIHGQEEALAKHVHFSHDIITVNEEVDRDTEPLTADAHMHLPDQPEAVSIGEESPKEHELTQTEYTVNNRAQIAERKENDQPSEEPIRSFEQIEEHPRVEAGASNIQYPPTGRPGEIRPTFKSITETAFVDSDYVTEEEHIDAMNKESDTETEADDATHYFMSDIEGSRSDQEAVQSNTERGAANQPEEVDDLTTLLQRMARSRQHAEMVTRRSRDVLPQRTDVQQQPKQKENEKAEEKVDDLGELLKSLSRRRQETEAAAQRARDVVTRWRQFSPGDDLLSTPTTQTSDKEETNSESAESVKSVKEDMDEENVQPLYTVPRLYELAARRILYASPTEFVFYDPKASLAMNSVVEAIIPESEDDNLGEVVEAIIPENENRNLEEIPVDELEISPEHASTLPMNDAFQQFLDNIKKQDTPVGVREPPSEELSEQRKQARESPDHTTHREELTESLTAELTSIKEETDRETEAKYVMPVFSDVNLDLDYEDDEDLMALRETQRNIDSVMAEINMDDTEEFEEPEDLDTTHPELVALMDEVDQTEDEFIQETPELQSAASDKENEIKASTPIDDPYDASKIKDSQTTDMHGSDDEDIDPEVYRLRALSLSPVKPDKYDILDNEADEIEDEQKTHNKRLQSMNQSDSEHRIDQTEARGTSTSPIHTDDHGTDTLDMYVPADVNVSDILDQMRKEYVKVRGILDRSASPPRRPKYTVPSEDMPSGSSSRDVMDSNVPDFDISTETASTDTDNIVSTHRIRSDDSSPIPIRRREYDREINIERTMEREINTSIDEERSGSESVDSFTVVYLREGEPLPRALLQNQDIMRNLFISHPSVANTRTSDTQTYIQTRDEASLTDDYLLKTERELDNAQRQYDDLLQHLHDEEVAADVTASTPTDMSTQTEGSPCLMVDEEVETDASLSNLSPLEAEALSKDRELLLQWLGLKYDRADLTVQLMEADLMHGIGETDAILRALEEDFPTTGMARKTRQQVLATRRAQIDIFLKEREITHTEHRNIIDISSTRRSNRASLLSRSRDSHRVRPMQTREQLQQLRQNLLGDTTTDSPSDIDSLLDEYRRARDQSRREIARARAVLKEKTQSEGKKVKAELTHLRRMEQTRRELAAKAKEEIRRERQQLLIERSQSESPARPRSISPDRPSYSFIDRPRSVSPSRTFSSTIPERVTATGRRKPYETRARLPGTRNDLDYPSAGYEMYTTPDYKRANYGRSHHLSSENIRSTGWGSTERLQDNRSTEVSSRIGNTPQRWKSTDALSRPMTRTASPDGGAKPWRLGAVGRARSVSPQHRMTSTYPTRPGVSFSSRTSAASGPRNVSPERPVSWMGDHGRAYELYSPRNQSPERPTASSLSSQQGIQPILDAVEKEIEHLRDRYSSQSESAYEDSTTQSFEELYKTVNKVERGRRTSRPVYIRSRDSASSAHHRSRDRSESPLRQRFSIGSRTSAIQEESSAALSGSSWSGRPSSLPRSSLRPSSSERQTTSRTGSHIVGTSTVSSLDRYSSLSTDSQTERRYSLEDSDDVPHDRFSSTNYSSASGTSDNTDSYGYRGRSPQQSLRISSPVASSTFTSGIYSRSRSPEKYTRDNARSQSSMSVERVESRRETTTMSSYRCETPERDTSTRVTQRHTRTVTSMSNSSTESEKSSTDRNLRRQQILQPISLVSRDYVQIARQAVQTLLNETLLACRFDPRQPTQPSEAGGWSFQGEEREVLILRKEHSDHPVHSFLGIGIIRAPARAVYDVIRNPSSRYLFDRMLKKMKVIEKLSDNVQVLYMLHETAHCFLKQSRDMCIVQEDSIKGKKHLVVATSVQHPDSPTTEGAIRAEVVCAGAVIEPVIIDGRECCKVSYLTQVDLRGELPTRLLNLIARRQPLCIAYMRNYIEISKQ